MVVEESLMRSLTPNCGRESEQGNCRIIGIFSVFRIGKNSELTDCDLNGGVYIWSSRVNGWLPMGILPYISYGQTEPIPIPQYMRCYSIVYKIVGIIEIHNCYDLFVSSDLLAYSLFVIALVSRL